MRHRSTTLKYLLDHCGRAMVKAANQDAAPRDHFEAGTAAHAILQAITDNKIEPPYDSVADKVVKHLTTQGRKWDGKEQAPMPVEKALEGRNIALSYLARKPLGVGPHSRAEIGLGIDYEGRACAYDSPNARYVAAIDRIDWNETYDEEDGTTFVTCEVVDYKSAWPAGKPDLESLQRKGQAVLVYEASVAKGNIPAVIRLTVVNLRTSAHHSRDIYPMSDSGRQLLEQWKRDILLLCEIADKATKAAPGFGCVGCPFTLTCDEGKQFLRDYANTDPSMETIGKALAYAKGVVEETTSICKTLAKEGPIIVGDTEIGYETVERRSVQAAGLKQVATAWLNEEPSDQLMGLLQLMGMSPSAVEKVSKKLGDESLLDAITLKPGSRFALRKRAEDDGVAVEPE
jgi:hypothetical protein